jgi:ribonuclease D
LQAAREAIAAEAERQQMPVENLLSPDILRRIAWEPPQTNDPAVFAARMEELGARPWQTVITAPILASLFVESR